VTGILFADIFLFAIINNMVLCCSQTCAETPRKEPKEVAVLKDLLSFCSSQPAAPPLH
jgi:hypothetical protein